MSLTVFNASIAQLERSEHSWLSQLPERLCPWVVTVGSSAQSRSSLLRLRTVSNEHVVMWSQSSGPGRTGALATTSWLLTIVQSFPLSFTYIHFVIVLMGFIDFLSKFWILDRHLPPSTQGFLSQFECELKQNVIWIIILLKPHLLELSYSLLRKDNPAFLFLSF